MDEATINLLMGGLLPSKEKMLADKLRRQQDSAALRQANEKANSLNMLQFATSVSNNDALAEGTKNLAAQTNRQYAPVKMGEQGFMLPSSGEYTESPMYTEGKEADRQQRVLNTVLAQQAANQRAQEMNTTRLQLGREGNATRYLIAAMAAMAAANRNDKSAEKAAEKAQKDIDTGVTRLSQNLEKAGWPEIEAGIETVRGVLNRYGEGKIPGYGRIEGLVPDWASTNEMQMTRADMQGLANIILKSRSGAAVTEAEQLRFLREIGAGKSMDEQTLRRGWNNVFKVLETKRGNLLSGASDDVLNEYNRRFGSQYSRGGAPTSVKEAAAAGTSPINPANTPAGPTPARPAAVGGKKAIKDMTDAELEAFIASGGKR